MSGTRQTYKQDLIKDITHMVRSSGLSILPESCLTDMSTKSLAEFQVWLEPLVKAHPKGKPVVVITTTDAPQLPAGKKAKA